jgi:hypothetical protein
VLLMTFVAVSGIGAVFQNVIRDKLGGGVEFLVSLPVDRRVLASSRTAACCLLAVPPGACLTAVGALALRSYGAPLPGPAVTAGAFGLAVTGVAAGAVLGMGVSLRLKAAHFANVVIVGFLAGLAVIWLVTHVIHPSPESLRRLAAPEWFAPALISTLAGLLGATSWLGYYLAWTGLERFRPDRDQVSW